MAKNEKPKAEASKAEAAKGEGQQPAEQAAAKPTKSGGMLKYILFGVGGLGLLAAVVFATVFFLGGKKEEAATAEAPNTPQQLAEKIRENAKAGNTEKPEVADSAATTASTDSSANTDDLEALADSANQLNQLVENINVMNQAADSANAVGSGMSVEDSVKAMTWLDKEKADLAQRESALAARERALNELDKKVSQKVLKVEQASSDRVANLAKLYDGMDADAVAKLVANLEDSIVVAIIPKLKQKNASALLTLMPPQRAAKISKEIITLAGE